MLLLACVSTPEGLDAAALDAAVTLGAQVDDAALMATVEGLVEARAQDEGEYLEFKEFTLYHAEARRWCTDTLTAMGFEVVTETTTEDGVEVNNLLVDIPGASRPEELVLLTAHYDAVGPGADDNGSALAALFEAARLLQQDPPARTVRLVLTDWEEVYTLGARRYYRDHQSDDVVAVVNLDAVGVASSAPGSQRAPTGLVLPDTADFLGVIGDADAEQDAFIANQIAEAMTPPLPLLTLLGPGDLDNAASLHLHRSDHSVAWAYGLPALFLTDTADFRSDTYHTPDDLPETLNPDFLAQSARLTAALAYARAEL